MSRGGSGLNPMVRGAAVAKARADKAEREALRAVNAEASVLGWEQQHADDIRDVEDALKLEHLFAKTRVALEAWLDWLRQHPGRSLTWDRRDRLHRAVRAHQIGERIGHVVEADYKPKRALAKGRRRRDEWAPFMKDRALLPMKPPGASKATP